MTAVVFLVTKLNNKVDYIPIEMWDEVREIIQQALEMEKQQLKDAYDVGYKDGNAIPGYDYFDDSESYYEKTYKKP
jgi:hypothetical protein